MSEKEIYNLVLGLAGPYGAGCRSLAEEIGRIINDWPGCVSKVVHVADLIKYFYKINFYEELIIEENDEAKRREVLQDAGTKLRDDDPELVGKIISATIYREGNLIEQFKAIDK
ncbi:hypothetical protein QUF72_15495, partial [Desulfobacterales bacterium HSG2]|nr:hypothetical protein [Desulfobacterales bacterium HSG2]